MASRSDFTAFPVIPSPLATDRAQAIETYPPEQLIGAELDWVIEKCDCNVEGGTTLSIYRWKDDRLEFDTPEPGKPRSTEFPTEKGSLLVLRRKP